jgi:hypothetical protein
MLELRRSTWPLIFSMLTVIWLTAAAVWVMLPVSKREDAWFLIVTVRFYFFGCIPAAQGPGYPEQNHAAHGFAGAPQASGDGRITEANS